MKPSRFKYFPRPEYAEQFRGGEVFCQTASFFRDYEDAKDLVKDLYTHAPRELLKKAKLVSELEAHAAADSLFRANWSTVKLWSTESRYNVHSRQDARSLIKAVGDSRHGVMAWIKRYW